MGKSFANGIMRSLGGLFMLSMLVMQVAAAPELSAVSVNADSNDQVVLNLRFSEAVTPPSNFTIQAPNPSVVLDFLNVKNALKESSKTINQGAMSGYRVVQGDDQRLRVVVDATIPLTNRDYKVETAEKGRVVRIVMKSQAPKIAHRGGVSYRGRNLAGLQPYQVLGVDFRRGENNAGKLVLKLSNPDINVNVQEKEGVVSAELLHTGIPKRLLKSLDVTDFGTPVTNVELQQQGTNSNIVLNTNGSYQQMVYQMGNNLIIEVRPISSDEKRAQLARKQVYNGERISLNFQDIKVRAVLQLLAEFTGLNIVTSDSVSGSITLRLKDVPWDQAMDIIFKTQGLAERRYGNVIMVAPATEISSREKAELEAEQQVADLSPIESELIQVNYAKADDLATLIKGEGGKGGSILSDRGTISVDARTNTLWVQDTTTKLNQVRDFIHKLDMPVRQVIIKTRIVNVSSNFTKDLGIQFGVTKQPGMSGTLIGGNQLRTMPTATPDVIANTVTGVPLNDRLNVNLPAAGVGTPGGAGSFGLALANLGSGTLLDLELSAMESEGGGEIISSPTLVTSNQQQATIQQGVEIPYQQAAASGATTVAFKKAVLSLQVTPQITPDNHLILTLQVNQDTRGELVLGVPSIDTRQIQTQVLVNNGETIVLGGIYEQTKDHTVNRIPFLGDLPLVGRLFKHTLNDETRHELLIFITPKIVQQQFSSNVQ